MPELEVIIFNQKLKISYQEDEKIKLLNAVEKLNNHWNKFSHLHGKVSDLKIITLLSLELQDLIADMEIKNNNNEIYQIENTLDDLNNQLLEIKKNILKTK